MVHSHITFLTQDAEQIVKVFLSLDFAKPEPSLKLVLEQAKLLHLVYHVPVICGEWYIDRGLTEDRCGRLDTNEVSTDIVLENRGLSDQNDKGCTKMTISQKPLVRLLPNFHSSFLRVSTMM